MTNINERLASQVDCAVLWIDNLSNYKQAIPRYRGRLGNNQRGYCCLGAGCEILDVEFTCDQSYSKELKDRVGLAYEAGHFIEKGRFYGQTNLGAVNDNTKAGFKRIATLLKTKPEWMFVPRVAELIKQHYATGD